MPQHKDHSPSAPDAPEPVRAWRLLLLMLLLLLPVIVSLASPQPFHAVGETSTAQGVHTHSPSDTPVCHHGRDHQAIPGVVADKRDLNIPTSGEGSAALPSNGPAPDCFPRVASAAPPPFSIHADTATPVYLLTQRLRV